MSRFCRLQHGPPCPPDDLAQITTYRLALRAPRLGPGPGDASYKSHYIHFNGGITKRPHNLQQIAKQKQGARLLRAFFWSLPVKQATRGGRGAARPWCACVECCWGWTVERSSAHMCLSTCHATAPEWHPLVQLRAAGSAFVFEPGCRTPGDH
jgi:hypothetical protein